MTAAKERLEVGKIMAFETNLGVIKGEYMGNARIETLEKTWRPAIKRQLIIKADSFFERGVEFPTGGKGLMAIETHAGSIRIVTEKANPTVMKVHNRMPVLI